MEELIARHRKESRDLTARITQKKKQATKKTRRGVNAECDALERGLKEQHEKEIQELENPGSTAAEAEDLPNGDGITSVQDDKESTSTHPIAPPEPSNPPPPENNASAPKAKKPNRHQARLARRAAEMEAASAAAEAEAASMPNQREQEMAKMAELCKTNSVSEHQIPPDGHCLYSAFADQLTSRGIETLPGGYKDARRKCAEFMKSHADDFSAFLEEDLDEHVRKVGETAEWGGQTEVLALGRAFNVAVNIVQAEGRGIEKMNEDAAKEGGREVWLGYYRHSFGLGEHYNSLRKMENAES